MCWHGCSKMLTGLRWKDDTSAWSMSQANQHGQTLHQKQAGKETGRQGHLTHEQALVTTHTLLDVVASRRQLLRDAKPQGQHLLGTGPSSGPQSSWCCPWLKHAHSQPVNPLFVFALNY